MSNHATPALTLRQIKALGPCNDRFDEIGDRLPARRRITVAEARAAGCTIEDLLWVIDTASATYADIARRRRLLAADYAAHVLHIYEAGGTDTVPRRAIIAARQHARGEIDDAALHAACDAAYEAAAETVAGPGDAVAEAAEAAYEAAGDTAWVADAAAESAVWAAGDAAARAAKAAGDTWAAWFAASPARVAEREWQFSRLVAWFSADEPGDWPLPEREESRP